MKTYTTFELEIKNLEKTSEALEKAAARACHNDSYAQYLDIMAAEMRGYANDLKKDRFLEVI